MEVQALLGETGWLRRLALSLVKDPAAADDLVQDAVLIAREKAPPDRPLRPWLSRVVLNLVRMRARSEKRRTARELRANEGEATPEELFARVETQRMLAEAVLALDAPYRDVVLLHYVEDLSSVEIGKRLGIADATVRWRLKTALTELRARLDARSGKRGAWLAPVGALANSKRSLLGRLAGGFAMKKLVVAIVLVLAALLVYVVVRDRGGDAASGTAPPASTQAHERAAANRDAFVPAWLAQPGIAPRRLAGHVYTGDKPVAGARVEISVIGVAANRRVITTTVDGSFDLGTLPAASYLLGATAATHAPTTKRIDLANPLVDTEHVVLELGNCVSTMTGTIDDSNGGPIARVRILVDGAVVGETDATGHYELCVPPEATLQFEADGYATLSSKNRVYGRLEHDVALPIEGSIAGVVTANGEPVANAHVVAVPFAARPHSASIEVFSGADGSFQVGRLGGGMFRLVVDARGLSGTTDAILVKPGGVARQDVTLAASESITGRVVMDGKPTGGVRVHVASLQTANSMHAYSQRDGSFVIPSPPQGRLQFETWPHKLISPKTVERRSNVTLEVKPTTTIRGRVLLAGKPVRGAYVICDPISSSVVSERDGTFELAGLDGPSCNLAGYSLVQSGMSERVKIELRPGTITADVILSSTASVSGTVVDETGAPVANAFVRLSGEGNDVGETMTDARGVFEVESLIGKMPYHPHVYPSPAAGNAFTPVGGAPFDAIPVPAADTQVTGVRLAVRAERLSIRGRIVDHEGAPVSDVLVTASGDKNGPMPPIGADSERDGRFEIKNLAKGRYLLFLSAMDGASMTMPDVMTGSDVTVTLPKSGGVEAKLVGFRGPVLVGTHDPWLSGGYAMTWWEEDGLFKSTALAPGVYYLSAHGSGSDVERITVRANQTTHVELVAHDTARVDATLVTHGTHAPIANAPCIATSAAFGVHALFDWAQLEATTDATGHVAFPAAPVGHLRVQCMPQDMSAAAAELDVVAGGAATVEVTSVAPHQTGGEPGFRTHPHVMPPTVWMVPPERTAAAAGLAIGDQLVKLEGEDVSSLLGTAVNALAKNKKPGERITLVVRRAGEMRTISFVIGKL